MSVIFVRTTDFQDSLIKKYALPNFLQAILKFLEMPFKKAWEKLGPNKTFLYKFCKKPETNGLNKKLMKQISKW